MGSLAMGLEAEIKILKRQNRRLKIALFSTLTVLIVSVLAGIGITSFTAIQAVRAREQTQRAVEMERQAREQAVRAVEMEKRARVQLETALATQPPEIERAEESPARP